MDLKQITPVVLTFNESANLERTLRRLRYFDQVLVLDSGSTDGTQRIAQSFPNVRLVTRQFDAHARQWNYAIHECAIDTPWVLALDADYWLPDELLEELQQLDAPEDVSGYRTRFRYCINGHCLSGSLYPDVTVLFRRHRGHYRQDGHTQRLELSGPVQCLHHPMLHDDRKPLGRWLQSQDRYAELEAHSLRTTPMAQLSWPDRVRRMIFIAPWLVPLYCLTVRRGLLDGRAGLLYALQRSIAECILAVKLLDRSTHRLPTTSHQEGPCQ